MSGLSPTPLDAVVAACQAGAVEAAEALGRSLDGAFTLGTVVPGHYPANEPPIDLDEPGLILLLTFAGEGLAICLPESSGMLPAWCATPDATEQSKLNTLAREFNKLLAPAMPAADKFDARRVNSLTAAIGRGGAASDAALVTIDVTREDHAGTLRMIWPLATPAAALAAVDAQAAESNASDVKSQARAAGGNARPQGLRPRDFSQLPSYARTLLKIRLPVSVHLASKKESVEEVVELVPGAIIKFEKGCDELLHMVIGGQMVAEGEAVKVGDKFGFRVSAMLLPHEHFVPARRPRAG
jgi:flagellar motor switch protein FliN/FliY